MPFGEYVPLPRLFFFARQVSTEIGAFRAPGPAVLVDGGLRIGVGVCYEILYPSLAREEVDRLHANLLVTISNDSWYGRAGAQAQHFAAAVLRSVETGRYLLRAAITGISGIVDDRGRTDGDLPAGLAGDPPGRPVSSRCDRVDALGLLAAARRRRRRERRATLRPVPAEEHLTMTFDVGLPMTERDDLIARLKSRLGAAPRAPGLPLIWTPRGARSKN